MLVRLSGFIIVCINYCLLTVKTMDANVTKTNLKSLFKNKVEAIRKI